MNGLDGEKRHKKYLRRLAILLLAVVCVAGTELAVCSVMDPALFQRITRPVSQFAQGLWSQGREWTGKLQTAAEQALDNKQQEEEAPPVSQAIQEPEQSQTPLIQDPAATQFSLRGDLEILTGGVVELVYFNQGEEPWAKEPYGPDHIGGYGCGPTAMSMVISSLCGQVVDPAQMAQLAYELGYCAPGSGSYLSIVQGLGKQFGLEAHSCEELSPDELLQLLASGKLLVALMGPGHFTSGGHFIVLRGVTLTGQVLVADPNSRERSLALWDPQLILDELSASRSSGAPLWYFDTLGSE